MTMQHANDAKASFDDIYVKPDPREYFSVLGSLDYSIPSLANPIFRQVAAAWRRSRGRSATLLDLGSSYGINSALFRFPVSFDTLRRRYARREVLTLPSAQLRALDRNFYSSWPRTNAERIVVADVSAPAIDYAVEVGLAEAGIACDLENGAPSADTLRKLDDIDIVMSTGCVGYVTEKTFATILAAAKRPPWVVSFCLRMFNYDAIENTLALAGLKTEKLHSAAFVQRRFRDQEEAESVLKLLNTRGVDPTGLESEGLLFAELYLSRPEEEAAETPLDELVTIANGRNISFGPRLLQLKREGRAELAPIRV